MTGAYEAAGRVVAGRYQLLRRLGTGGMGRVWLAHDQELACEVALKEIVLSPDIPESEVSARIARARGEAQHAARLRNHPHVVTVYDIVESGGLPWIVMEFVPGATDLEAVVREQGPLPLADVRRIGLAILDALMEGHRLGVLHRDVKPANVLLTGPGPHTSHAAEDGRVLLTDYGIALEPSSGAPRLTAPAEIIGTVRFMAPERLRGETPTPASDLFSLGGTLYFALEGTGPFDRGSDGALLSALLSEPPAPPRRAAELAPLLLGLLAKDPEHRMNGDEAAQQLTSLALQPSPASAQPVALPTAMPSAGAEEPVGPKSPRSAEPTPQTELLPPVEFRLPAEFRSPAEPEEPGGPPPKSPSSREEKARPHPRPPRPGRRRAGLIAGAVALVAGGAGIYLALPDPPAPASVSSIRVGGHPEEVAVSPDGRRAYVTNERSGSVSVIDTATNKVDGTIPVGSFPKGVEVSPDGHRAYVANLGSGSVSVIDTATNKVDSTVPVGRQPDGVAVSPGDGSQVYVTNGRSGSVSVIDTETNKVDSTIPVGSSPAGVAMSPDGRRAYVANLGSGSVSVIDTATNKVSRTIPVGRSPQGVDVSPDGRRAYVTSLGSGSVSVIDTATNEVDDTISVGSGPQGVAVAPENGRWAYVTSFSSGSVSVIDTATNEVDDTISVGSGPAGVAMSPDGRRVYVADFSSGSVSVITA
ncbi:serine/threonine-protein kinase [Streptomyces thermoalcalitolerans]|uniref:Protein kinase domain-containing protein n=1 Tax=Streptomyces thermoalcalitolerans TaxID=65605 RepID=A0ABN1NNI4_9ACTN